MDDPRLASARLHSDIDRLGAQAALSWPQELAQLTRLGLSDGMFVLELGSGPGFITERLLEALPHSHVTAVELDPAMTDAARRRLAGRFAERLEIIDASILQTDLPSGAYDFALARLVFQHLASPELALMEIARLLKPGGMLAVIDADDSIGGLVSPHLPAFDVVARKVRQAQARSAGDREIGRKLWRLLRDAGFTDLDLQAIAFHSDDVGLERFLPQYDPDRYHKLVATGALSQAEWTEYRQAYARFVASPDAFILQILLLVAGRSTSDDHASSTC